MSDTGTFFSKMVNSKNKQAELDKKIELQRLKNEGQVDGRVIELERALKSCITLSPNDKAEPSVIAQRLRAINIIAANALGVEYIEGKDI